MSKPKPEPENFVSASEHLVGQRRCIKIEIIHKNQEIIEWLNKYEKENGKEDLDNMLEYCSTNWATDDFGIASRYMFQRNNVFIQIEKYFIEAPLDFEFILKQKVKYLLTCTIPTKFEEAKIFASGEMKQNIESVIKEILKGE